MKGLLAGPGRWWRVEVVLRRNGGLAAITDAALVNEVARRSADIADAPPAASDPAVTFSYDAQPPEGSLGVAAWVRAETAGAAIDGALETVVAACRKLSSGAAVLEQLWDVRAVPVEAVVSPRP